MVRCPDTLITNEFAEPYYLGCFNLTTTMICSYYSQYVDFPTLIFSDAKGNIRSNVDITLKYLKLGTKRLTSISDLFAAINILQNLQKIYESISMALNNNFQFKLLS